MDWTTGTALWYATGKPPIAVRWVLVRDPANIHPTRAFFTTDLYLAPAMIIAGFVSRWSLEVTYEECRAHLGIETQRQWSDLAIEHTTPALFGLFSLVVLMAHALSADGAGAGAAQHKGRREPVFLNPLKWISIKKNSNPNRNKNFKS